MKTVIEMAREADIAVAHMNKPMTDEEVRLAWCNEFATLVREDERKEQALQRLSDIHQEMEQLRMLKDDDSLTIAYMAGAASKREKQQ